MMLKKKKRTTGGRFVFYAKEITTELHLWTLILWGDVEQLYRESTGTAALDDTSYGDPVQKAEAMAFRRACARFGLGLHLYHEDLA